MAIRIAYLLYVAAICVLLATMRSPSMFVTASAMTVLALWTVWS